MAGITGICTLCGEKKVLTFEHVPPKSTGENKPTKLYSLLDSIGDSSREPWDFQGLKYEDAQKGTGGYSLCAKCNNQTGVDYVPAFTEFIKFSKEQNIQTIMPSLAGSMSWTLEYSKIKPLNISKQILLMIACTNNHGLLEANPSLDKFLNDKHEKLNGLNFGLYMYINAGVLSVSYPITALSVGLLEKGSYSLLVSGINAGLFSFQLELNSHRNKDSYFDISDWANAYDYNQEISLKMIVPVKETNIGLPGNHKSIAEMIENKAKNLKS